MVSIEFLITSLIVVLMPGTGVLYGWLATSVRHYIIHSEKISTIIQRIFSGSFAALGIKLALTTRE